MKRLIFILLFLIPMLSFGQIYHEAKDGQVQVLSYDSTEVIVKFDISELRDVSTDYDHIRGLKHHDCYKYEWVVQNGELNNHKGLFVVKNEDGSIYTVWLYENTEDGRGRLSKMLRDNFDY